MDVQFYTPKWFAMGREADLATEQIASGITALGRAHYGRQGLYSQAFFGLSIGIERLAKLIYISATALEQGGTFPKNEALKKFSHNLDSLLNECQEISRRYRCGKEYWERPNDSIHAGIIKTLSEFAQSTRYYNLDVLSNPSLHYPEPIAAWWERVGNPILLRHGYAKSSQAEQEFLGRLNVQTTVIAHSEDGVAIRDVLALAQRQKQSATV